MPDRNAIRHALRRPLRLSTPRCWPDTWVRTAEARLRHLKTIPRAWGKGWDAPIRMGGKEG